MINEPSNENKSFPGHGSGELPAPGGHHSRYDTAQTSGTGAFASGTSRHSQWTDDGDEEMTMPGRRKLRRQGDFRPGEIILKRYRVISELGRGGMGVVYKCFDSITGVDVAMKMLQVELSAASVEMEELRENFQLIHTLHHPNIAASNTLEYDSANGILFLVMECVEGTDLRRWIKEKRSSGPITPAELLPVIRQIASALDFAHKQNILHRDIKPGNVMITPDGTVKVLDFGLATQICASMTRKAFSNGETSGTAPYMAPEQWRGSDYSAAVDQYALGVLTYELLAGRPPFHHPEIPILREIVLNEAPAEIPGLPKYVQKSLQRVLSKKAEQRFRNCSAFAEALAPVSLRKIFLKKYYFPVLALLLCLTASAVIYAVCFKPGPQLPPDIRKELEQLAEAKKLLEAEWKKLQKLQKTSGEGAEILKQKAKELAEKEKALIVGGKTESDKVLILITAIELDIKKSKFSEGPEFKKHIHEMDRAVETAKKALSNKKYSLALSQARQADRSLKSLKKLALQQAVCADELKKIEQGKRQLESLDAPRLTKDKWAAAEKDFSEGKKQFEADQFEQAKTTLAKAGKGFEALRSEASRLKKAELLKTIAQYQKENKWDSVLAEAKCINALFPGEADKYITEAQEKIRQNKISTLQQQLDRYLAEGQLLSARETADQLLALQPGTPRALYAKGRYALNDRSTWDKAYEFLQGSAEKGVPEACLYLGHWYSGRYDSRRRDPQSAFIWYRKAAEAGITEAQFQSALYLKNRNEELFTAFKWFLNSAQKGNPQAAFELAECYEKGLGTQTDTDEAFKWYRTAAEQGIPEAQFRAASSLKHRNKELSTAFKWFLNSAQKGSRQAAFELAECYEKGIGTAKDKSEAFKWYIRAAQSGHATAQLIAGRLSKDSAEAVEWFKKAAEQGIPEACYELGCYYAKDPDLPQHRELADKWMTAAAAKGVPGAHKYLGDRALQKKEIPAALACYRAAGDFPGAYKGLGDCHLQTGNKKEAQVWYEKALRSGDTAVRYQLALLRAATDPKAAFELFAAEARKGDRSASCHLAECFYWGRGVKKDVKKAFELYRELARSEVSFPEYAEACFKAGLCCFEGYGTKQDFKEAARFFEMAARKEHREAQRYLAECFHNGQGVAKDRNKAVFWYEKAAALGDADARCMLGVIYASTDKEKSLSFFRAAGNHPGALLALAVYKKDTARLKELFKSCPEKTLRKFEPLFSDAHFLLGKEAYKQQKTVEAFVHFSKITSLTDPEAQLFLGDVFASRGDEVSLHLAFVWYQKAAAGNSKTALYKLGLCFFNGKGTPQDKAKALGYLRKAAAQNSTEALYLCGKILNDKALLEKAAASGHREAQFTLARAYASSRESVKAFSWYRQAALQGHPEAQLLLAGCYADAAGTEKDMKKAEEWYLKAAENGSVQAQFALAQIYERTPDGMEKAKEWYLKAAENGSVQAQFALAGFYLQLENYALAAHFLRKINDKEANAQACFLLAQLLYSGGKGLMQDQTEAEKYFLKAAQMKHVEAMFMLGTIYYNAVPADYGKAFRYFHEAALLGDAKAQFNLYVCYRLGRGVAANAAEAHKWLKQAARQGLPEAEVILNRK